MYERSWEEWGGGKGEQTLYSGSISSSISLPVKVRTLNCSRFLWLVVGVFFFGGGGGGGGWGGGGEGERLRNPFFFL